MARRRRSKVQFTRIGKGLAPFAPPQAIKSTRARRPAADARARSQVISRGVQGFRQGIIRGVISGEILAQFPDAREEKVIPQKRNSSNFNFYVAHPFLPSMEFVPSVPMAQPIVVGLAWRKRGRRREANQGGAGRRFEKFSRNEAATRFPNQRIR